MAGIKKNIKPSQAITHSTRHQHTADAHGSHRFYLGIDLERVMK